MSAVQRGIFRRKVQAPGFRRGRLVFVAMGSRVANPRSGNPRQITEDLAKVGIKGVFYASPDTAHEFQSWRRSLREFAPLLFRD